jgi:predicted protein tyrosine phosphatase
MDKTIACYSRREVERGIRFKGSYALISIRDPGSPAVRIPKQSGLVEVLELQFHDAEPTSSMTLPSGIEIITEDLAFQIAEFVRRHHTVVDGFAIHCEQGMSRSPAVGAAIARYLKQPHERYWQEHQPNRYVYELTLEALESV